MACCVAVRGGHSLAPIGPSLTTRAGCSLPQAASLPVCLIAGRLKMILFLLCAALFPAVETYTIGPEDVLTIHVWRQPEVTRRVAVRPDGKISLALLNDVQAAGLSAAQLARRLNDALKQFFTEADVSVV